MSDVIKVIKKNSKVTASIKDFTVSKPFEESEKEKLQLALHNQYSKGFSDGEKTCKVQLESVFNQKLTQKYIEVDNFLLNLDQRMVEYNTLFEDLVVNTSFILAEKILQKELKSESIITEVLNETLKKVIGANKILVRLNPKDYELILSEGKKHNLKDSFTKIRFEEDDRIEIGGCLVESEIGNADGRISSQLNELRKKIVFDDNIGINNI
jgi:flagellar assembly protein FliH